MRSLTLSLLAATVLAGPATAKVPDYIGAVEVVRGDGNGGDMARGRVFLDENRNSRLDPQETGVADVSVSNGREVVVTDAEGRYALPVYEDMNLFITKPAGHAVPLDETMVPQFAYVHKEQGSPPLRFGGIAPTGPFPEAVNFPLIVDPTEGEAFKALAFGDTQPYSNREIGYVRDTVGAMLLNRDTSDVEFLIFQGDVMGDDLSLFPRFKQIVAQGRVPTYFDAGNHDIDFDATQDADSFDTFRREWGPQYYSFDVGDVHFVVLDNVRYPCNGVDDHPFCDPAGEPNYNGVVTERQVEWLVNDLATVPQDKLIVLSAHIPFQSYVDSGAQKHQTDNFATLVEILRDRPVLTLAGHTHTTEQIVPGEAFAGFAEHTGVGASPFHQIITGAVSGSWWGGDLDAQGVPHATQRLGSPRGFYELAFSGPTYNDRYVAFGRADDEQLHASFNSPRFREWASKLFAFADSYDVPADVLPPVIRSDLGDMNILTREDLEGGTWVAVNVWSGSKESTVDVSVNGGPAIVATRTQAGEGEGILRGPEYADPLAVAKQATQGRTAWRSATGGEATAGYQTWKGVRWQGQPGPFQPWMLTRQSNHVWRADLPADLPEGHHELTVRTTDRYGRTFTIRAPFEVVAELPPMDWNAALWNGD